jgi:hypothetical protein
MAFICEWLRTATLFSWETPRHTALDKAITALPTEYRDLRRLVSGTDTIMAPMRTSNSSISSSHFGFSDEQLKFLETRGFKLEHRGHDHYTEWLVYRPSASES